MHDYFGYPDATFDTPTKPCQYCNGKGWRKTYYYAYSFLKGKLLSAPIKLPSFKKCITCDGSGIVDLNQQ